jgi:hypothetical protein
MVAAALPVRAAARLAAHPLERRWSFCPAVQNVGLVVRRIPDTVYHQGAWQSRNAGRMFHPKH